MFRTFSIATLIFIFASMTNAQVVSILVDPGHGGNDPGHLPIGNDGIQEKVLALDIALKVGNYLSNNLSGVNVGYTRTDDSSVSLDAREQMANSGEYDYMLSVHINGNPKTEVYGTETLIHDYDSKDSHKWAKLVESQFKKRAGRKSRGVKTRYDLGHSLQILKFTKIPTIIVECGFITNPVEANYLSTVYGQEIIASAIFRATREFFQYKHPDIDFTPSLEEPVKEVGENTEEISEEKTGVYRVQIMSSIDPVEIDVPQFKKLDYPVERVLVESTSLFKYKYYVGAYESKKEAKTVQKEVQESGFQDAFIVFIK